jgi:hypothetical protein
MKYSDRFAALNSEIPFGGFGRNLTSSECKTIRQNGYKCSQNWIVVRANDSPHNGILYYPCKTGGYNNASIYVTTK